MSSTENLEIALRLISSGAATGCTLRLFGGTAFYYHRHKAALPQGMNRTPGDIDFACYSRERWKVEDLLKKKGFSSDRAFNAVQAPYRAKYHGSRIEIDIVFDEFVMCHRIDLRSRLNLAPVTLALADLIMTKLQIVNWTEKDFQDVLSLLVGHSVVGKGADQSEEIDSSRIAELVGRDWGLHHTTQRSLGYIDRSIKRFVSDDGKYNLVKHRLEDIQQAVQTSRKSIWWRLRALAGERLPWHGLPE